MITIPLKLRCGKSPPRQADAWFIPGSDVADWLAEIASWDVPHGKVRLLLVPRSRSERSACGVLAFVESGELPAASGRCVAFARVANRMFIPADAWFDPDVSETELRELLGDAHESYTHIWHPAPGLAAFEPADVQTVASLIALQPPMARMWDAAQPGVAYSRRLISLMPEQTLSFEQLLQEGRDDIGSEGGDLNELPPSPSEPQPGVGSAIAREGTRMLANIAQWLANRVPGTANSPTWVNDLENWARRKLGSYYAGLDSERNKEITRLLNLLKTDPDHGLRFALPMGGESHRGIASPSGRLMERMVDFSLGGLGGGIAADFWDLSAKHRQDLATRYRELANREINLGRHRRAAYIFAQLLGDLGAAAGALEAGRHWREAAVLYQQKLNRPLEAARCLEQGGLWAEAIALYQEQKEHEKAGDLLVRLDQREAAETEYRQAAANHHAREDHHGASRIYLTKLDSPDEALDELASGWPSSSQAAHCLQSMFALLGKLGRHSTAQQWITRFRDEGPPERLGIRTVEILAETATKYPDRETTLAAADCTRRLISRQIMDVTQADARQLLMSLGKLAPEDKLLTRDCQRFLSSMAPVLPTRPPTKNIVKRPRLVRVIALDGAFQWKAATWSGDTIFAAGIDGPRFTVVRCGWDGTIDASIPPWRLPQADLSNYPIILAISSQGDDKLIAHLAGNAIEREERTFSPSDRFPQEIVVDRESVLYFGGHRPDRNTTWLVGISDTGFFLVRSSGVREVIYNSFQIELPDGHKLSGLEQILPIPIHARSNKIYVGLFDQLSIFDPSGKEDRISFADRITSLSGSAPNTRTRIALTFPHGAAIFWDDVEGRRTQHLAEDRVDSVAGFNRGGYLIVADSTGCEIYGTSGRHAKIEEMLSGFVSKPIAVLSAPRTDQFGIAFENGQIHVYEMP